jgi:hypothetical protein
MMHARAVSETRAALGSRRSFEGAAEQPTQPSAGTTRSSTSQHLRTKRTLGLPDASAARG